jgi:hypothetical protein
MLNNKRQNFHHSKLPNLGDIVEIHDKPLGFGSRYRKFIVESFNLCDNALPYSIGIHTVNLAALNNRNEKFTVSGFYCEVVG